MAVPYGMHPIKVEAVGLVTGLPGTGSDPEPSPQRDELLGEMKAYGVSSPNQVLSSGTASLVLGADIYAPGFSREIISTSKFAYRRAAAPPACEAAG